jgi:hypothetical protein
MNKKTIAAVAGALTLAGILAGCSSAADTTSHNLSQEAENFELQRRVVFFNGITDKYLLEIEGRCSIETSDSMAAGALEVTCKVADDAYKKHFLGLSDNVSFFVEQLESRDVSAYHYQVRFRPETIVPEIDLQTSNEETD